MDAQMDFRSLLLKLQERLSERDRRHLHFLLGDTIPRQLRNDPSICGTLELLETLFDQAKIGDQDFGYLIQAFREIGCSDIVKRLELHQKTQEQRKLSKSHQVMNELFNDIEDDQIPNTGCCKTDSSVVTSSSLRKANRSDALNDTFFRSTSFSNRRLFLVVSLLLTIFLFVFLCILIGNGCLKKPQSPRSIPGQNVIEGFSYGTNWEMPFDDGVYLSLGCEDRCIGVEAHWRSDYLYSIRFLYDRNSTLSLHHGRANGTHAARNKETFMLQKNEEIYAITLYNGPKQSFETGTINFIVGIVFHTTYGQTSSVYGSNDGNKSTESFPGYTFSYAKGHAGFVVDRLQFVWCNMCSKIKSNT